MKAGIIGVTGYTGQELIQILDKHPNIELVELGARVEQTCGLKKIAPQLRHLPYQVHPVFKPEDIELIADAYILALPHQTAMEYAKYLTDNDKIVIDLSADFRFQDHQLYEKHYVPHLYPELNKTAVYGLPELFAKEIEQAKLIANPGCYPTSILLGGSPLIRRGLSTSIISDSKSGVSGAGYKPKSGNIYCFTNESMHAYNIGKHRHEPEIKEVFDSIAPMREIDVTFAPHLVPMDRGMLSTLYIQLLSPLKEDIVRSYYEEDYADKPFIRLMDPGESARTKNVIHSNFCDIGIFQPNDNLVVITSAIDNLGKGASSQAVHNLNLVAGFKETAGLL